MNINLSFVGQIVLIFAIATTLISYYLGRRKVETPIVAALLGFVFSIVPIFGLLYVVVLMFKKNLDKSSEVKV